MSRALLDVNVLLALIDQDHLDHRRVRAWAADGLTDGWATCAITQNGFVRIISQPRYTNPVSVAVAIDLLRRACSSSVHESWPCDVSLLDAQVIDRDRLHGSGQVTDAYLLAVAVAQHGRLVTLDRAVPLSVVRRAEPHHLTVL